MDSFKKEFSWKCFFAWKSFVKMSILYFIKEFPCKLTRDLQQKNYKRIACNFDLCSFYKGFPCNFFYVEIFCKFFPTFQTWIGFCSHFLSEIRKLENSVHNFFFDHPPLPPPSTIRQNKLPTRLVPRRLDNYGCIWDRLTQHYILDFIFHFSHFKNSVILYIQVFQCINFQIKLRKWKIFRWPLSVPIFRSNWGENFSNQIRWIGKFSEVEKFPVNRKIFHFTNFKKMVAKNGGEQKALGNKKRVRKIEKIAEKKLFEI